MKKQPKMLNITEIYNLVKEYYVILPDAGNESYLAEAHKRAIRRIIDKKYDTTRLPKTRKPVMLSKRDALQMVLYDDELRRYFLRHMSGDAQRISAHFSELDSKLNEDNLAGLSASDEYSLYASIESDSYADHKGEVLYNTSRFALESLFGYPSMADLLEAFGIDAEKYEKAYITRMDLMSGDQPYPIQDGFSEIDYKLRRPTIYFRKQ